MDIVTLELSGLHFKYRCASVSGGKKNIVFDCFAIDGFIGKQV
jgi:hypothetical protein